MASKIATIYRKELLDTLRDKKTLLFMLLIPAVAMPLMIVGINKLVMGLQKKQALETVKIAATEEDRANYAELVHAWFLRSQVAASMRMARSPLVLALLKPEEREGLAQIPQEIFEDPRAFEAWVRELASKAREGLESDEPPMELKGEEVPEGARSTAAGAALDFYRVAFKGLGLIEWIDPTTLETPPAPALVEQLGDDLRELPHIATAAAAIKAREIHGLLCVPAAALQLVNEDQEHLDLFIVQDSTIRLSDESENRIDFVVEKIAESVVTARLQGRDLDASFIDPLNRAGGNDVATKSERALFFIGGFLPYIIIAFAFMGGMYPAIDLGAGEKERGTLETIVLSPATRTEIALGKFFVILTTALVAAFLGVASIALSIRYLAPEALLQQLDLQLPATTIIPVALLTIPPAAAFAGLFLAISIYARSFKEAQNYIAPLQFVLILPAMAPMLPGMEMSWKMALIPLVNVSMLSKDFLQGDTNWGHYAVTFGSCFALAGACIAFAVWQFRREQVLFRS